MKELAKSKTGLPKIPKELAPFIAVGNAAVSAARKVLKSGKLSKEQFESVLQKAQEQGEIVIDAKAELGKVIVETPKGSGRPSEIRSSKEQISKQNTYTDLGITRLQAAGCETVPEAAAVQGKIIPFPGVSLSDHFQSGIDAFLKEMGYIE